ncbi:MAG: sigma-70 family RNA polymerase sigma factor [Lewinella sp.]|nr:sigma-70 family RNA polymerase sigma factor [Lewinella sp.]
MVEQSERELLVRKTLRAMPDLERDCLIYFYFKQLSYRQIAEVLDEPLSTIKSTLQRGKRRLRQLLENQSISGSGSA